VGSEACGLIVGILKEGSLLGAFVSGEIVGDDVRNASVGCTEGLEVSGEFVGLLVGESVGSSEVLAIVEVVVLELASTETLPKARCTFPYKALCRNP